MMEQWLDEPPAPKLMKLWASYTRALMSVLPPKAAERIRQTVLAHARSVAESAGGFLGFGRVSKKEEKILQTLQEAFEAMKG